ncbi:iron-sulfur cluster repair di-iron protein [Clostridium botulinum]|uniref:Putative scdA protein n=1 Tax=Clostridium botulinum CFSAN001627 TaxID=1232189 RepID=M1ZSH2_CLOBO|nr:iron-sulfur cluster repair di-iron protein [Clostridium botulinum]EKN37627.1 putative scdA protein [Clostridium botulinum CFSAN001627]APC79919.1 iron-sulfur cluster repair di-iron protein [Clostridium botulinum]APC83319.1 iron-sulfur cluster repair di-iron protein [Clostridium botulinum]AXG95976.1 iron-sulfur cluster repair di-iron protein [Clostridium botulinum]EDT82724.1 putative scdA protein [Clostridium botulinum NCTC 2916]
MKNTINVNQKLGEVVSIFPGLSRIFNDIKIDYCCGGHDTLGEALKEKGINSDEFIQRLNEEYKKFVESNEEYIDWRKEKPVNLMENIVDTHHDYTKRELKEIDALLLKILKVHFGHHGEELLKVHRLFGLLKIELEEHLIKEEENLFPLIKEYEVTKDENVKKEIDKFIKETEDEHDKAGDILKELEKITRDFKAPEGACTSYRLTYDKIHNLEKDLFIHIYKENSVLFEMI